ncbi:MAG: tRNA-intron lyase [Candidatus Nanoarchaeia archaeon]
MAKIKARLVGKQVSTNAKQAMELFSTSRFGEKSGEKILYSLPETLYLLESGKLDLYDYRDKKMSKKKVEERFEKMDKRFRIKYAVFYDLRKRGYLVKTALKFGAEFRVYDKEKEIGKHHARWILYPVSETEQITWQDFSAKNRVAHSTNKKLLIGVVDEEGDVSYYEVGWKKP